MQHAKLVAKKQANPSNKSSGYSKLEEDYLFLQSVIDGVADPIIVIGTDLRVKLINHAAKKSSAFKQELHESQHCYRLMFGLDKSCSLSGRDCPLVDVLETGKPVCVEHKQVLADGEVHYFEILATPLESENGNFLGIIETFRDITDRKFVEKKLKHSQIKSKNKIKERTAELVSTIDALREEINERLRVEEELVKSKEQTELFYRVIPSAIFTVDRDRKITSWNDKAESITGYTGDEVIGKGCNIFALEPCTNVCGVFSSQVEKPIIGKECKIRTKAGKVLTIAKNADLLKDRKGKIIGAVESFENITHLKQVNEELRTERDKIRGMLTAVGQGMHIVNRDYCIEYQNEVLRDNFGDRIGDKCYSVYKQQSHPCEICAMQTAIETNHIQRTEVLMADDKYYEQSYAPYKDVDGETKVLIMLRDITEEKAYQAETLRAGQLASVGELAAGVAHEINNPINGIINYAQILLDDAKDDSTQSVVLDKVIRESERVATIVSNLLSFSRQHDEERDKVYVDDVIYDSVDLLKHQLFKDSILLDVKLPEDLPPVYVNHQQLQQVFLNLLSNARYALNKQYPVKDSRKQIVITGEAVSSEKKPFVRVTVTDKGTGISPEILDKIFDPFFSSKEPGEGTGLGLSISHGIIKNFQGYMHVKSVLGEYTSMIVELPVYSGEEN